MLATEMRVRICRQSDYVQVGSMPARAGMETGIGTIEKVNRVSVIVTGRGRVTQSGALNISIREARKYGWPTGPDCRTY